jgi:serine/threonine-protein kinase HipA
MEECRIVKFNSHHQPFLTKRFDCAPDHRLHFISAMTQLRYNDGDYDASYLKLYSWRRFFTEHRANTKKNLVQLSRRIVFNIALSNTDDHLRSHGFIYSNGGWLLSLAYDINPVSPANGLHLNITYEDNSLNFELAMGVVNFFPIST